MEQNEIKLQIMDMLSRLFPNAGVDTDVLEFVDLIDDLGMDSITFMSIVVQIETIFNIIIPDHLLMMEEFRHVEEIINIVENTLKDDAKFATGMEKTL